MSTVIFELPHKGDLWRLEVVEYNGRTFANWRKWWRDAAGEWKASKEGVTFPLYRLPDLRGAIENWEAANPGE